MAVANNKKTNHNLLIIGNGFDLTLGLKSDFQRYLNTYSKELKFLRNKLLPEAKRAYQQYVNSDDHNTQILPDINGLLIMSLSSKQFEFGNKESQFCQHMKDVVSSSPAGKMDFWSIYLSFKHEEHVKDWSNVESQMYKCVTQIPNRSTSDLLRMVQFIYQTLGLKSQEKIDKENELNGEIPVVSTSSTPEQQLDELIQTLTRDNKESLPYDDIQKLIFYSWVLNYIYTTRPKTKGKGFKLNNVSSIFDIRDTLLKFLKQQVFLFERHLNVYLIKCVEDYTDKHDGISYYEAGRKLINTLVPNHKFSLLNFNYTNPLLKLKFDKNTPLCEYRRNIHGVLTSLSDPHYYRTGPVIGISDNGIQLHDGAYVFTKNYRIMRLSCNEYDDILYHHVNQIEFFGHSFDSADRLYFFNIFDRYQIKNCKVRLVFYYIDHSGKTDDECAVDQMNKVDDLFEAYVKYHKKQGLKDYLDVNMKDLVHILSMRGKLVIANIRDNIKQGSTLDKILKMNENN